MEKGNLNRGMSVGRMSRAQSARLLQRGTSEKKLRSQSADFRGTSFAIDPSYFQAVKDFCQGLLPGLPEHAALKKKAVIFKRGSAIGAGWDIFQVFLSVVACVMYIAESYEASYAAGQVYEMSELIYTQFFAIDFLFNWFIANSTKQHFTSLMSIVDIITVVPVYVTLFVGADAPNLSLFRFVRILRLIRILRTFRLLGGLSGIKRQLITLTLSLLSLTFVAAGIIQFMENDLNQFGYDCQYINANTNYEPSCESDMPTFNSPDCDCAEHNCRAVYARGDDDMEPSGIRCIELPYFDCFYFIVVTMATVGYGDIAPSNIASKIAIILFIITSLVLIPMQVNKLSVLLSMHSAFRRSYVPQTHENHVILCGYVNDRSKLERFFKEFFHPDKRYSSAPEFNLVILSPMEPSEDVRSLLVSPLFDIQVTYIIGSALSTDDLKRARADIASAMFFVCNIEVPTNEAYYDDAATVLRTLSVSNFNPELECLVQVLRPEDRDILKDSDVDVILCLDEYKTAVQARNAVCPGLSTLIENIFHSFGQATTMPSNITGQWMTEYLHGCRMEIYYIPLGTLYLEALAYEWNLIVEGIYVEFEVIMIGVCSIPEHAVFLNPGVEELAPFEGDGEAFFKLYNVGILMAPSQSAAELVANGMNDTLVVDRIMAKMLFAEEDFSVRRLPKIDRSVRPSAGGSRHMSVKLSVNTQKTQVTNNFRDLVRHTKMHKRVIKEKEGTSDSTKGIDSPERRRSITRWHKGFAAAATHVKQQKAIRRVDSTTITDGMEDMQPPAHLGHASQIVTNASHISNHIIVFGCVDNLLLFVKELRRPLGDDNYHPVLIVNETIPPKWDVIAKSFKDVYLLNNVITSSQGFNATNIRSASSVVLLASRDNVTMVEEENLDAEILFTYLKLERYIPRHVFFTVELTHPNNMGVLNSTIMRRKRADVAEASALKERLALLPNNAMSRNPGQIRGTFSTQRRSSEDKNASINRSKSNMMTHTPGRRLSSLELKLKEKNEIIIKENNFWDVYGTHHVLPVFAAGRSFVPSSFDSVLVQVLFIVGIIFCNMSRASLVL